MDGRNHNHAHHHESHVQISTTSLPPANPIDGIVNSLPDLNVHSHGHHHHDHGHAMQMFFHGGFREVILFDFWRTETFYGLFFSLILVFLMAVLYEGAKWFRVYFQLWTSVSQKSSGCISMDAVRGKFRRSQHGVEAALIEKATAAVTNSSASGCNACDGTADDSLKNTIGSQQQVYAPTVMIMVDDVDNTGDDAGKQLHGVSDALNGTDTPSPLPAASASADHLHQPASSDTFISEAKTAQNVKVETANPQRHVKAGKKPRILATARKRCVTTATGAAPSTTSAMEQRKGDLQQLNTTITIPYNNNEAATELRAGRRACA
ncbi:hypothetical protein niasHT_023227 [Heterodera trifolii]|uniref:Copper transport protein n=1 Tax=Heterodera trifolii TaxID=157864 RepID=A0ABD2JDB3_9BILA